MTHNKIDDTAAKLADHRERLATYQNVTANGRAFILAMVAISLVAGLEGVAVLFALVLLAAWGFEQLPRPLRSPGFIAMVAIAAVAVLTLLVLL